MAGRLLFTLLCLLPLGTISALVGRVARWRRPRWLVRLLVAGFQRLYRISLEEVEVPEGGFPTLDALFTRPLRGDTRPLPTGVEDLVVAPVDGVLGAWGQARGDRLLQVKGRDYSLHDLLGEEGQAEGPAPVPARRFEEGWFFTLYLSPRHYHRIHSPAAGQVCAWRHLPGRLWPVNRLGLEHVERLFAVNERMITWLETPGGPLAVVKVGATSVGRITLAYAPGAESHRAGSRPHTHAYPIGQGPVLAPGEEMATFHLGSTVVVLLPPRGFAPLDGLEQGQEVRVGTPLARVVEG